MMTTAVVAITSKTSSYDTLTSIVNVLQNRICPLTVQVKLKGKRIGTDAKHHDMHRELATVFLNCKEQ